ncbi:MAG: lipid-A-disaccharide synthase [Bacteroidetes bacterium]|nr:lipid-A-disaccharide synthase [Bacteroidota bacterium]
MRYYIIAGERSGDLHASNLIRALRQRDENAVVRGFGGDLMKGAGADLAVHYEEMAFMGFVTLIRNYGTIRRMLKFCKQDILKFKPDVVIHIDYGGFNRRIAKFTKASGITTFYYIPPKVWAWYQSRARELKESIDRMFVILPFEKEFFRTYGMEVDYVGNPVLDAVKSFTSDGTFLARHGFDSGKPIVALLPGSRKMELARNVPTMLAVVDRFPQYEFGLAALSNLDGKLYEPLRSHPRVHWILDDTYNLLQSARAAIVCSGTATLETGLFKVPQVCVYRAGWLEMIIARAVVQVKHISLINLIVGTEVIRELIQEDASPASVCDELKKLVEDNSYRDQMISGYQDIYHTLDIGSASDNTARLMIGYLRSYQEKPSPSLQ